ncbi:retrovirus-related pol polyprotein from transposon TNT 1-94 [Tanacetum coccineum]
MEEEEVLVENAANDTPSTSQAGSLNSTPNRSNFGSDSDASLEESMQNNRKFRSIDDIYAASPLILFAGDPLSVEEAIKKEEWRRAMEDELQAINKNMTWELVSLPQGIDYEETFSPVARFDTVRIILALAAQKQWKVFQFDVKSAFLNGDLHEEVYVSQPLGFENSDDPNKVFRLKKALYGLKQAPRAWYTKIDEFFHKNGFERSEHEPTLYLKKQGMNEFMIVSLYVDDMIYTGSSLHLVSEFKKSMMSMFDMTDLGELRYFLGLEIVQTDAGIFMSQKKYVEDTLQKFNMVGCKTVFTPMNINEKLQPEDGTGMVNGSLYRSLIGRLLYLTHSCPDISFSIGVLSRFMHKPSKHHFGAAKRVLRYLAGTKEFGILFRGTKDMNLKGFTDSDWAGSVEDRRSTSGNCFLIGSTVSWSSKN